MNRSDWVGLQADMASKTRGRRLDLSLVDGEIADWPQGASTTYQTLYMHQIPIYGHEADATRIIKVVDNA